MVPLRSLSEIEQQSNGQVIEYLANDLGEAGEGCDGHSPVGCGNVYC